MERVLAYRKIHPTMEGPRIGNWPLLQENLSVKLAVIASLAAGGIAKEGYFSKYDSSVKVDKSEFTPFDEQAERTAAKIIRKSEPDSLIMGEEISPDEDIYGEVVWVADGIDGTTNYSRRILNCNFTLAKVERGSTTVGVVYDFMNGDIYYSAKGQGAYKNGRAIHVADRPFDQSVISFDPMRDTGRQKGIYEKEQVDAIWNSMREITEQSGRFHREIQSGGLEISWIASGQLDGYAGSWTNPWDLSGGVLILKEAGGVATNILGEDWQPSYWGVIAGSPSVQPIMLEVIQGHFEPLGSSNT